MAAKTKTKNVGDIAVWEADQRYTRETVTLSNGSGSTASYEKGLVLEPSSGNYIPGATAGNVDAILLDDVTDLPDGETKEVSVLIDGPCLVNQDALDYNGLTAATVRTALIARGFKFIAEPVKVDNLTA